MNITQRRSNAHRAHTINGFMNQTCICSACNHLLGLPRDSSCFTGIAQHFKQSCIIYRAAVHKRQYRALSERTYLLMLWNLRKVCRGCSFHNQTERRTNDKGCSCSTAQAWFFLYMEAKPCVHFRLLTHQHQHDCTAQAVIQRLCFEHSIAKCYDFRRKCAIIAE